MKKPKNPVLVLLTMAFLSCFIILPPYLRKVFPKQEKIDIKYDKIILLTCKKYDYGNELEAVSKCVYRNGKFESNTVAFQKLEVDKEDNDSYTNTTTPATNSTITLMDEYNYISSLIKSEIEQEGVIIFKIDTKVLQDETMKEKFKDYIQAYGLQKKTYESIGYQCSINRN